LSVVMLPFRPKANMDVNDDMDSRCLGSASSGSRFPSWMGDALSIALFLILAVSLGNREAEEVALFLIFATVCSSFG
jgi:hypothetical protein